MVSAVFWRTIFFYFLLLVVMRVTGKREIGGLAPVDLVVTILLAELAAIPIQEPERPVLMGAIPIATIMLLQLALSALSLRNRRWRTLLNGSPSVIIKDGKLVPSEMKKIRYTVDDVLEQLRRQGYASVSDVEVAVIETDGNLSVIPKSQRRPLQPRDLSLPTAYEGMALTIITDGEIEYQHLKACGLDMTWLQRELKKRGITDHRDAFCAILDTDGTLFVQRKEDNRWYLQP